MIGKEGEGLGEFLATMDTKLLPRYKIGQVWKSKRASQPQTIVAINPNNKHAQIITQHEDGDTSAYRFDGTFLFSRGTDDYDLLFLVSEAPDYTEEVG